MADRYTKELKQFGKRVKKLRKQKGYTQDDLSWETGIERAEISRIENGLRNLEFNTLVRLAIHLDVELRDFFTKEQET
jgi:HTH-type transcriptional regulator, competence development regulator